MKFPKGPEDWFSKKGEQPDIPQKDLESLMAHRKRFEKIFEKYDLESKDITAYTEMIIRCATELSRLSAQILSELKKHGNFSYNGLKFENINSPSVSLKFLNGPMALSQWTDGRIHARYKQITKGTIADAVFEDIEEQANRGLVILENLRTLSLHPFPLDISELDKIPGLDDYFGNKFMEELERRMNPGEDPNKDKK